MNSKNECEYCPSGFYQEIDNHKADSKRQIRSCKPCPAGTFAPRHKEINHFEEWPKLFSRVCTVASELGHTETCLENSGWFVNENGNLESSGSMKGIISGMKYSMKGYLKFENLFGGKVDVTFRMDRFSENEHFRILVNG